MNFQEKTFWHIKNIKYAHILQSNEPVAPVKKVKYFLIQKNEV